MIAKPRLKQSNTHDERMRLVDESDTDVMISAAMEMRMMLMTSGISVKAHCSGVLRVGEMVAWAVINDHDNVSHNVIVVLSMG